MLVPKEWAMLTSQGNRSLRLKAEKLVESVENGNRCAAFRRFFKGWKRMHGAKTFPESSDTVVRESVFMFALGLAKEIEFNEMVLEDIWNEVA